MFQKIIGTWEYDLMTERFSYSKEALDILEVGHDFNPSISDAFNLIDDEQRIECREEFEKLLNDQLNFEFTCCLRHVANKKIWVRATGQVLLQDSEGGMVHKIGGILENVTADKITELKKDRYWNVLNQTSMISITDRSGTITYVNQKFCELTGFQKSEMIGKNHRVMRSGFHDKDFFKKLWDTINSGESWSGEILNKNADGKFQWIKTDIFPIKDHFGEIIEFVSLRQDITDKKQKIESDLANERLKSISEVGGQILHEIMSPLSVVTNRIELLDRYLKEGNQKQVDQSIESLKKASSRVVEIFNDMRSFLKEEDKFTEFDLFDIVKQAYFYTHLNLQKEDISFANEFQGNLKILGNRGQLIQVLTNLINNSAFAVKKLEDKWIRIRCYRQANDIIIDVIDSGPGISDEVVPRLFDYLYTTKKDEGGTGLGLSIAKRVLSRMNSNISYLKYDGNTCFRIIFPSR